MQTQALPGFRDFFPDEAAIRNHLFGVWRDVATRYGFQEYDGPPLEPLELYTKKSGDEIVGQLYNFEDRGGRAVAFRPEMTPTLARMVASQAQALKKPIRWFSIPQLLRYERPQRGRLREHYQLNMDLIGEPGPLADAEIIAASLDIMRSLGLTADDLRVRVSDRRVLRALLMTMDLNERQITVAMRHLDKVGRDPRDMLHERLAAEIGVPSDVAERILSLGDVRGLSELRDTVASLVKDATVVEGLSDCVEGLEAMGLGTFVEVDLSIVRGLAYYEGIVFELFDVGKSLRAICGGGRYDGLIGMLGGPDLPAVGFGMGDVVLTELLKERNLVSEVQPALDFFLVAVTIEDTDAILALAHRLRAQGRRVEYSLKQQSIGKQLKLAAARPARRAVIIGPEERAQQQAVIRDLASGTEQRVPVSQLLNGDT